MKKIILFCIVFAICNYTQAQLLKKLKEKAEKALEKKATAEKNKTETKVDNTIDNTIDNAVDGAKKTATGGDKTKPTETTKSTDTKPATSTKPATPKPTTTTPNKKMTYEEKELATLYAPTPYVKYSGEVPNPKELIWPNYSNYSFFDEANDGVGYFVENSEPTDKSVKARIAVHYYKVDKNLKVTPYLSFEVGKYEEGDNSKRNLINNGIVKKDGNIWSIGVQRNGMLLYQIEPNGNRTTLAGSSYSSKKIKDGKGADAWISSNARLIKELPDGSVLFTDGGYEVVHESFPDMEETGGVWRIILPDGEIKTVTDKNGKPIRKQFHSNIIADKNGYWYYSNDYEIVKLKPGLVVDSIISVAKSIYKNNENSEYELSKTAGKQKWVMGKLGVASFPGISDLAWGPNGEIYFYSTASKRFALLKNGTVSHYTGTSDFSNWYSGHSLGAKCGPKKDNVWDETKEVDGTATTSVFCGLRSMKWIDEHLVVLRKDNVPDPNSKGYFLPSFKLTKIDKAGNTKSLPTAQNL